MGAWAMPEAELLLWRSLGSHVAGGFKLVAATS